MTFALQLRSSQSSAAASIERVAQVRSTFECGDPNLAHSLSTLASTERAREMSTVEVPLTRHRDRRHTKCRIIAH